MNKYKIIRIIDLILIILWAVVIFFLSGQDGEDSTSLSIIVTKFFIRNNDELLKLVVPYVRKLAHFSEYGVGGVLFCIMFLTYKWKDEKIMLISFLIGVWYAILDEIHQTMIFERHGSPVDVYIDSLGVLTGICFMMIIYKIYLIIKEKKENKISSIKE